MAMKKSVVILNLGGPLKSDDVKPFLFNLFYDKAIINLPNPLRYMIAKLISSRREKKAIDIYNKIGGGSPILDLTNKQADALKKQLQIIDKSTEWNVHVCMRYWHPFAAEVIKNVEKENPDEVILLPLYPQYSTTTTGSSFKQWRGIFGDKLKSICCYADNDNFINAHIELIRQKMALAKAKYRILFSAHGLPEKIIKMGDPYQHQVEITVAEIIKKLGNIDHSICYQSRVGPMKWIGPSTENEIKRAGQDGLGIILVPVAFVSEHSETLVELDMEYKHLAEENGVKEYIRVPALGTQPLFISALADIVSGHVEKGRKKLCSTNHICGLNGCI